jgi:two-component system, OmpR family, sensor histidine kinase CiaH
MRVKLALNFVLFVLILYAAGALAAITMFKWGLNRGMDATLMDLLAEIRPAVQITAGNPSLRAWANVVKMEQLPVLATIHLFDRQGRLLESYGPEGIPVIATGRVSTKDKSFSVASLNAPVSRGGAVFGTLQLQISTAADERAMTELISALVAAVPVIGLLVAGAGYIFAGMALKPVEKTMDLLRRFVADAGHELKTPLSIIEASIETLAAVHEQHGIAGDETEILRKASQRMKGLTADLMFLAKVEDPMAAFDKVELNLNHLVEEVVSEYEPLAASHKIALSLREQDSNIFISAEPESFRQLVSNLVSNAIKYNDPGGSVEVLIKREIQNVAISVSDTGIGIPEENLANVFDRFYRADQSRSRAGGGAGLGLAIVKAVANAHDATVSVSSEVGKGTTFVVALPVAS